MAKDEAILSRCLTGLNGAVPYPIGAFPLLREELWHGRLGGFLLRRLDLSPFRPWNVIFLPLDSAGKSALGLPIGIPSHSALNELETIVEMICELYAGRQSPEANALAAMCDAAAANFPFLFPPEILDYSVAVRDARRRVRAFAFLHASTNRFDKDVVIKSQRTFLAKPSEQLIA